MYMFGKYCMVSNLHFHLNVSLTRARAEGGRAYWKFQKIRIIHDDLLFP